MILTVTLNPAIDLTLESPGWTPGAVNRATAVRKCIGGKGVNISRILKELAVPSTVLTVIGKESAEQFQVLARKTEIPMVYITVPGEMRTNVHIMDPTNFHALKVNQAGIPLGESQYTHLKLLLKQHLRKSRMVTFGGSLPPNSPPTTYRELLGLAREAQVSTLLDTTGAPLLEAFPEKPFIVKPNRAEAEETLKTSLTTEKDILNAARDFQKRGASCVIITDGGNRVVAIWEGTTYIAEPPKIVVLGATGAGDSLAAGVISGLERGNSFKDALRLGVACACATCLQPEGELGRATDINQLVERVKVRKG